MEYLFIFDLKHAVPDIGRWQVFSKHSYFRLKSIVITVSCLEELGQDMQIKF